MVYESGQIFLTFCRNQTRVTDRQTDRQTADGQTEFSSLDRVCIPCSAVKTSAGRNELKLNIKQVICSEYGYICYIRES